MTYPFLTTSKARAIGAKINEALALDPKSADPFSPSYLDLDKQVELRQGDTWDEVAFLVNVRTFEKNLREDSKRWTTAKEKKVRTEEDFAEHFMAQVELVGDRALQDPDFWRYLSLFPYRRFIYQLEGDLKPGRFGGDGNRALVRWSLIRGFLWGARTFEPEREGEARFTATRAYRVARDEANLSAGWVREFYISQIVRRYLSHNKNTYLAFIEAVTQDPPVFDHSKEYRPTQILGAAMGRLSANLYFPAMTKAEIKKEILEEKKNLPQLPKDLVVEDD